MTDTDSKETPAQGPDSENHELVLIVALVALAAVSIIIARM